MERAGAEMTASGVGGARQEQQFSRQRGGYEAGEVAMNYNLYINILYKVDHAKYTPHDKNMN